MKRPEAQPGLLDRRRWDSASTSYKPLWYPGHMIELEVCINCAGVATTRAAVRAAYDGGAARVELCRALELGGLTPRSTALHAARAAFGARRGMVVLVRPRAGDFCYTERELQSMLRQIELAAALGADGAALGILRDADRQVDSLSLGRLVQTCASYGLQTTFHRAFDATPDPLEALERLVGCGVARVLTSGSPWGGAGGAWEGRKRLAKLVTAARGRIEIVIGGGVHASNVREILRTLPRDRGPVSIHAYSGAQTQGVTTAATVAELLEAAQGAGQGRG